MSSRHLQLWLERAIGWSCRWNLTGGRAFCSLLNKGLIKGAAFLTAGQSRLAKKMCSQRVFPPGAEEPPRMRARAAYSSEPVKPVEGKSTLKPSKAPTPPTPSRTPSPLHSLPRPKGGGRLVLYRTQPELPQRRRAAPTLTDACEVFVLHSAGFLVGQRGIYRIFRLPGRLCFKGLPISRTLEG